MELTLSLAAAGVAAALTAFGSWKSGRPRKDSVRGNWISWPMVTVLAGAALLLTGIHAINLMGFHTGRDQISGPPIP